MSEEKKNEARPTVTLVGTDGNAFMLLGRCRKAARKAGWTGPEIEAFTKEAMAGDYDLLLRTIMERFDVE